MLQITRVISFFRGISHENHQNGSVPWCYKWQVLSPFFMVFPMKCIKTAQYHDATNDMLYLNFPMVFPMNFAKTAQYHDATNDRFNLHFSWYFPWISQKQLGTTMLQITRVISFFSRYFPWKSPKRLGTMMLQMTDFIYIFHGSSHEIHQNGSVPRCHK